MLDSLVRTRIGCSSACKCKGCSFCRGRTMYPPAPPKPPHPPLPPPDFYPRPPPSPPGITHVPEAPQGVRVSVATCGSISLKWTQPADTSPVIAYEVLYKRPSQTEPPVAFALNGPKTPLPSTAELTGLSPATAYQLRVRAKTSGGWSPLSSALTATTAPPLRRPPTPNEAPTLVASTCSGITLALPALRGGCSGDEGLNLEWREKSHADEGESAGWHVWQDPSAKASGSPTASREVVMSGLSAHEAYEARIIAHNTHGASAAGPPSAAVVVAASPSDYAMVTAKAPHAAGVGAAAVVLSWGAPNDASAGGAPVQSCRPQQRWEVLVQRHSVGGGTRRELAKSSAHANVASAAVSSTRAKSASSSVQAAAQTPTNAVDAEWATAEWATVRSGLVGTSAVLPSMRCPHGCRFKVHAINISGWDVYSAASAAVATPAEPPIPAGAVRVELAASLTTSTADDFAAAAAAVLDVDLNRVRLAYSYKPSVALPSTADASVDDATYIVLDLLAAAGAAVPFAVGGIEADAVKTGSSDSTEGPKTGEDASSDELAEALAWLMSAHSRLLWGRSATQGIIVSAGIVQVHGDGRQVTLWSPTSSGKEDYGGATVGELVMIVAFVCGVMLSCGLVLMIAYGTCKQSAGEAIPAIVTKKKKAEKTRAREATSGTAEEKISLAVND